MAREDRVAQRERLVAAALRIAVERGPAELTVRHIAEAAGTSTMAVYSGFGGRSGVLEELYRRAFGMLGEALLAAPGPGPEESAAVAESGTTGRLLALAVAYRTFALASPSRYAFMFDGAAPDFTPPAELRTAALETAFAPLVQLVSGDLRAAYALWGTMHGLVGLELAEVLAAAPPSWGVVPDEGAAERMYQAGVRAVLAGLGV
jgi:AcrR family transcriptional regulator